MCECRNNGRAGASRKCGRGSFREIKKVLASWGIQALERSNEKLPLAPCGADGRMAAGH